MELAERYRGILKRAERAASGRPFTLLAVSKSQPAEAIEALYRLGHRDFGENYAQELVEKAVELERRGCTEIRWHFIGHLQSNKVKLVVPHLFSVHSVDSEKLARELAKRWAALGRGNRLSVFLEVNISGEESKTGLSPEQARELARTVSALPELALLGLMCIPDPDLPEAELRSAFRGLKNLEEVCRPASSGFTSMGMSGDYELALQEGATHIRVGTALFGSRSPKV